MDFYEKIRRVCLEIPYGKAATYGQIALLCGKPKNSRQVGYALRTGKAGEGLPAHRVVNASGILSGAHAFATPDLQKRMPDREGLAGRYKKIRLEAYRRGCRAVLLYVSAEDGRAGCLAEGKD